MLNSVSAQFCRFFRAPLLIQLNVECQPDSLRAKVRCQSARGNTHIITLRSDNCCLWAYDFAHELCHILCGYNTLKFTVHRWFHEAICDSAAVFTIRQLASGWHYARLSSWAWFAVAIRRHAEKLEFHRDFQLPAGLCFHDWFKANERSLRSEPYQRTKNGILAINLLPIVERNAEHWEAIRFLPDTWRSFERFLREWQAKCPRQHTQFVCEITDLFMHLPVSKSAHG